MVVRTELVGVDPEKDVSVTLRHLVIRGERRRSEEVKDEAYYRLESERGTFERRNPVPEEVDEKKILAECVDGVLEIAVPKAAKSQQPPKAKRIPIKTTRPGEDRQGRLIAGRGRRAVAVQVELVVCSMRTSTGSRRRDPRP